MTLLELINKEIHNIPNSKALKSLNMTAFIEARITLEQVLDEQVIDTWIQDGLLDYSRRSKNRLKELLDILEVGDIDKIILIHRYEERKGKLSYRLKNSNHKITSKNEVIRVIAPDGTKLKGVLVWWSKDYNLYLNEPFEADCGGNHLMYAAPVVYVLTDTTREGMKCLPLLEKAKETLVLKYEEEKRC